MAFFPLALVCFERASRQRTCNARKATLPRRRTEERRGSKTTTSAYKKATNSRAGYSQAAGDYDYRQVRSRSEPRTPVKFGPIPARDLIYLTFVAIFAYGRDQGGRR
jgi:hypothetical protein